MVGNRDRCKVAILKYDRCRGLEIAGRGWCVIAREYGIVSTWIRRYFNRKYQEDLDASEGMKDSSGEESFMGDILFMCEIYFLETSFLKLLMWGSEW